MNSRKTWRFLLQWCHFAIRDAAAQAFGWPTIASAVLLVYFLPLFGVRAIPNQIANNLAIAAASMMIALVVYVFAGFFKAYRLMKPLVVTATDDVRSPDFAFHEKVRGYNVTVVVSNRSVAHLRDCVAYVTNAPCSDGSVRPRFVEKFDLPPKCNKNIFIAYWFSRESPNLDDKDIGLTGPTSATFGGNVCRVPGPEAILHVKIEAPDVDSKDIRCRVWIDGTSRRLKALQLPD